MYKVILELDGVELQGEIFDSPAGQAVLKNCPLELEMQRWGEEYYGRLPQDLGLLEGEKTEVLDIGDLAFWEPANALCVFFGPTPASESQEPRAASEVHRIGNIQGDWQAVSALDNNIQARLRLQNT
ncbi:MAG: cyclophilin-like fold protein [Desulfohalobiaceae bacterium]